MKIAADTFVAIDYCLTLDSGEEMDRSQPGQPLPFLYNQGMLIPGLERQLEGKEPGFATKITVEPEEGYGPSRAELIQEVPRDRFPEDVELKSGMTFQAQGPHGGIPVTIKKVEGGQVTVDMNHPLAGQRLHFDVKVVEVREATDDDRQAFSHAGGCETSGCDSGCCGGCHDDCN